MRKRTAKQLGTRHDRNYFKAWTRQKRWLVTLALAVPVLFLSWLAVQGFRGESAPYSSGQMSRAHAILEKQCGACHANFVGSVRVGGFRKHAHDRACLTCHQAPMHHAEQMFTPGCGSCHVEHIGAMQLTHTSDQSCTQCHGDLRAKNGPAHFANAIFNFAKQHPEFAAVKAADPGKVAFNHALHLRYGLPGPPGKNQQTVQLDCNDCHRPNSEANGPWRFGSAQWQRSENTSSVGSQSDSAYMAPVTFDKHCIACHTLPFDKQAGGSVPHVKPEEVQAFVVNALKDYLSKNPSAWKSHAETTQRVPGIKAVGMAIARNANQWLMMRAAEDESLLWSKTCRQCHQYAAAPAAAELPQVLPANFTSRWFKHALFDHNAHSAVRCDSCHEKAASSQLTSDVLIPGIEICRTCHSAKASGSAETGCFECHQYHDWKQRQPFRPVYSIPQITGQD